MTNTILILGGSGKIGHHSAHAFKTAGWDVRHFDRKTENMTLAAQGADVILNGLNPPNYHDWQTQIPAITAQVIAAAKASGATVILPGNVYHFGDQSGLWSENTPPRPVSRKGRIRLEMEQTYAQSGVQTIVLRAGNFIDPRRQGCVMSQVYLRNLHRNKITLPGPATTRQAMCYLPDWARAAVALAEQRSNLQQFEDIPFAGHTLSAQDIKNGIESLTNRNLTFTKFPWGAMRLAAPFWELARELLEMRYLWQTDHALDDTRLQQLLPAFTTTDLDTVFAAALPPPLQPS